MIESRFFKKVLTPAEVGNTGTHEKYIRLTNDFDYVSFFQQQGVLNGSVRQIDFQATDLTPGFEQSVPIPFKFVYYENSNREKRLPSLSALYNSHDVKECDIVVLESRTTNGSTEIFFTLFRANEIILKPDTIYYTERILDKCNSKSVSLEDSHLQLIYYGAPGTGKSHIINEITEGESVIRTTFHPDSDYSTFVGAYKPTIGLLPICDELGQPMKIGSTVLHKEQIIYEFVEQAFLQAYVQAWKYYADVDTETKPKKQYLVIEEINRGNCAQIFGDLFQLLDRNASGFSDYPINADNDMKKQLIKAFKGLNIAQADRINACYKGKDIVSKILSGEILLLPDNLYIWATMNTSDQSLFPIDSAFKRRWDWQYMPISKGMDNGVELNWKISADTKEYDWWSFLEKINAQVETTTNSEDKKLGFFFCKAVDGIISAEAFVGKVVFYLWNDVFKDFGFEGQIFKDIDESELSFNKFYKTDNTGRTIVQKDKVELFLNNLDVNKVGEISNDDNDSDENEGDSEKSRLTIKFSDGQSITESTQFESYLAALRKIGLDKAEQIASEKQYQRLGCALISKTQEQGILNNHHYSYIEEQGFFIVKGINSSTMMNVLKLLSSKLGLSIEVKYE